MSYLCGLMILIDTYIKEGPRKDDLIKKIDSLGGENTLLQAQYKEHEHENIRQQIELFNVEATMKPISQLPGPELTENTNIQLMETCTNMRYLIHLIDFPKIVQCNLTQLEQRFRKEFQQLQDYSVSLLNWHQKMNTRNIVQRYRKVEKLYYEMLKNIDKNQKDIQESTKKNVSRLIEAEWKLNSLVLHTIEGSVVWNKLKDTNEHTSILTDLRKQQLLEKLESEHQKTFSSMIPYNNSCKPSISSNAINTVQYELLKFPSFNDILKTFNQDLSRYELEPQITMIENTTNIMVKSFMHKNSPNSAMEINQAITTKHTKLVHLKKQLQDNDDFQDTTDNTLKDSIIVDPVDTKAEIHFRSDVKDSKMRKQIETIDRFAPTGPTNSTSKPKVDILECIVIKQPTSNKVHSDSECAEEDKENMPPHSFNVIEHKEKELQASYDNAIDLPQNPGPSGKELHPPKKKFYDELFNTTLTTEISSRDSSQSTPEASIISKDFEILFCKKTLAPDVMQSNDNFKTARKEIVENNKDVMEKDADCALDFGGRQRHFLDRSDNIIGRDLFSKDEVMDFFS